MRRKGFAMKKLTREKIGVFLSLLAVSLFFVLFFFKIHPLVLFDLDDFIVAGAQRDAFIVWAGWNPARVLAETLGPLVTLVSAFGIDFFLQDHFLSVSLGYAITVSLFITGMCWMLLRCLAKGRTRFVLLAYFLICHFWVFRTAESENTYMLFSGNLTCYFYYVIPNLLNCALVLWLVEMQQAHGSIREGFAACSYAKKSLFVLLIYFGVFSNIWSSIILGVYVGAIGLFDGIRRIREKRFSLPGYLKDHLVEEAILILWAIEQVYELSGARAASLDPGPYWPSFWNTVQVALAVLRSFNALFLKSALVIFVLGAALAVRHKEWGFFRKLLFLATAFLVEGLYMLFSCARVSGGYLARPDVNYGCFFYAMLVLLLCFEVIFRHLPSAATLLPLLLAIAVCNCNTNERTYRESTTGGYAPEACMRFCNDILEQMQEADREGRMTIKLVVPYFPAAQDNWPVAYNAMPRYTQYFYKMGLIEKPVVVTQFEVTSEKNAELGLYR